MPDMAAYDGWQITASGQIVNDPENAATKIGFRLRVTQAPVDGDDENVDANLFAGRQWLVYANPPAELIARRNAPYFRYGDLVTLSGSLQSPRPLDGFDYPAYLAAQGHHRHDFRAECSGHRRGGGALALLYI